MLMTHSLLTTYHVSSNSSKDIKERGKETDKKIDRQTDIEKGRYLL